jgi:hypothetical protein
LNKFQSFQEFLATQSTEVSVLGFAVNLLIAAILAVLLSMLYVRFGRSISNRKLFAGNFLALTMTTMFIITIVKSSLALSLGLVGALSIVRFRAAIKEPEELSYLFLAIAIGLGLGADQRVITLVAFLGICLAIFLRSRMRGREENENLHLTVTSHNPGKVDLGPIAESLQAHASSVKLKRFDETDAALEVTFQVEFDSFENLTAGKTALNALGDDLRVSFLDSRGLG